MGLSLGHCSSCPQGHSQPHVWGCLALSSEPLLARWLAASGQGLSSPALLQQLMFLTQGCLAWGIGALCWVPTPYSSKRGSFPTPPPQPHFLFPAELETILGLSCTEGETKVRWARPRWAPEGELLHPPLGSVGQPWTTLSVPHLDSWTEALGWTDHTLWSFLHWCGMAPCPGTYWKSYKDVGSPCARSGSGLLCWPFWGKGFWCSYLPFLCPPSPSLIQTQPPKQKKQNKTNFCLQLHVGCREGHAHVCEVCTGV